MLAGKKRERLESGCVFSLQPSSTYCSPRLASILLRVASVYIALVSPFRGGREGLGRPDTQVTVYTIVFATLQRSPPPPPLPPETPNTRRTLPMWNKLIHSEECFQKDVFHGRKHRFNMSTMTIPPALLQTL